VALCTRVLVPLVAAGTGGVTLTVHSRLGATAWTALTLRKHSGFLERFCCPEKRQVDRPRALDSERERRDRRAGQTLDEAPGGHQTNPARPSLEKRFPAHRRGR
jgi:hypothetical protein